MRIFAGALCVCTPLFLQIFCDLSFGTRSVRYSSLRHRRRGSSSSPTSSLSIFFLLAISLAVIRQAEMYSAHAIEPFTSLRRRRETKTVEIRSLFKIEYLPQNLNRPKPIADCAIRVKRYIFILRFAPTERISNIRSGKRRKRCRFDHLYATFFARKITAIIINK